MKMEIHPSAVVNPHAELASGVKIGPYSIIGAHVRVGKETVIGSHVVIDGHTTIGERNSIFPFVSIGLPPQDIGYKQEDTRILIGDGNIIREYTSINRATTKQDRMTILGNDNYLMAYSHVAHDCVLGNNIIMSNVATLGGHATVGDYANLGGLVAVHQFVNIGAYSFIGGKTGVAKDIPPFMIAAGNRAKLYGPNQKGLRRHGFTSETINGLKKAYRIIWRESGSIREGIYRVRNEIEPFAELNMLLDFVMNSSRGVVR
jgi:UDP-N-acetylglucosamine acyltransferase